MSSEGVGVQPGSQGRAQAEWLADFLDRYYAEEIAALCQSNRETLHVEAGDLRLFVDESGDFDTLMAKPSHYADVLEAAVEFCTSTQGVTPDLNMAIVDENGAGVLGKGGGVPHLGVADVSSDAVREYIGITGQLAAVTKIREFPRMSEWRCEECGARFDEPIRREPMTNKGSPNPGTTAALLEELDADAIGGGTSA